MSISQEEAIPLGTFPARASYGGTPLPSDFQGDWTYGADPLIYDDNYRDYVEGQSTSEETWRLLYQADLGMLIPQNGENFTAGGLYRSGVGW
jgi:hypothetical protein